MVGTSRHVALAAMAALVLGACQSGPAGTGGDTLNPSAQPPAVVRDAFVRRASFGTEPQVELVQLEATTDLSAGAERETSWSASFARTPAWQRCLARTARLHLTR